MTFSTTVLMFSAANSQKLEIRCNRIFSQDQIIKGQHQINKKLKVAAVQYPLGEKKTALELLQKIKEYVVEAKKNDAELVVFPELVSAELIDWNEPVPINTQFHKIAQTFTPAYIEWLKQISSELNISILAGTTPRLVNDQIVNSAILTLTDGKTYIQDKLFLTPDEKDWGWSPGKELRPINAPWGKSIITTCFDCEFPIVSQLLTKIQPELILVPSWTSTKAGLNRVDWTAHARAVEHFAYVVKTGTVPDTTSTQEHYGRATIIGPQDPSFNIKPINGKLNSSEIVYGDIDFAKLRERRVQTGYYPGKEQNDRINPIDISDE